MAGNILAKYVKKYPKETIKEAVNSKDLYGRIPLHYAASKGRPFMVIEIIKYTTDKQMLSLNSDTPRMKADYFHSHLVFDHLEEKVLFAIIYRWKMMINNYGKLNLILSLLS